MRYKALIYDLFSHITSLSNCGVRVIETAKRSLQFAASMLGRGRYIDICKFFKEMREIVCLALK